MDVEQRTRKHFKPFILHEIEDPIGANKILEEKVKAVQCQLMDYIHKNMNTQRPFNDLLSRGQITGMQLMELINIS
jgi:hypothetical protein